MSARVTTEEEEEEEEGGGVLDGGSAYSSEHLKKLFFERDSVIFTGPAPPGGLLSFSFLFSRLIMSLARVKNASSTLRLDLALVSKNLIP